MKTEAAQTTSQDSSSRTILIIVAVVVILLLLGLVAGGYFGFKYVKKRILGGFQAGDTGAGTGDAGIGGGIPTLDYEGEDVPGLSRYPDSVRIFYGIVPLSGGSFSNVAYLSSASINDVLNFYSTEFNSKGWTVLDTGDISKMPMAEKDGTTVIVTLTESDEYLGYTDINIVFGLG